MIEKGPSQGPWGSCGAEQILLEASGRSQPCRHTGFSPLTSGPQPWERIDLLF
jgi:hypothetical protein